MRLPGPQFLGLTYLFSEILLTVTRRSRSDGVRQDKSTLRVLWVIILVCVMASVATALYWRSAALPNPKLCALLGLIFFVGGLALRWWAIIVLGRFFTVDVQIAKDHQLVERGPFRLLRHPSYTGVLLAFLGFGLSLANWAALIILMVPITLALLHRINVEEQALSNALGNSYRSYMQRTKRLIPGLY